MWLKQSTAAVIPFGPFTDKTDGVTLEIGLVSALDHGTTGILLSKNGGTLTIRHASVTATTYDAHGVYRVTLDTTDTNTLGRLRAIYTDAATCLPVWQDFLVVSANVYDSFIGGGDILDVSMTQILGTAVATPATAGILDANVKNINNVAAATPGAAGGVFIAGTNAATSVTTALTANITGNLSGAVGSVASGGITAASLGANAINASKLDPDVATELQAGLATTANVADVEALVTGLNDISAADILTTALTESYAADGSTMTVAQALYMVKQMLMEMSISGTTMTVRKLDGSTSAMTFTLSDATNPTSITRAS